MSMSPVLPKTASRTIQGAIVTFKEPSFRMFLTVVIPKLGFIQAVLAASKEDGDATDLLARLMADDGSWALITSFVAACSDKPADFFKDVTLTEAFDVISALQELDLSKVYSIFRTAARQVLPATVAAQ